MAMFTDAEVVLATGARILQQGRRDMLYRNVTTDTRTVGEDDLFAALKGEKFDGHTCAYCHGPRTEVQCIADRKEF